MTEEKNKQMSDDMRFVLYREKNRTNERAPVMTGTAQIAGVTLRIAMWPKQVGKSGVEFWSGRIEYQQGARRFLVPVDPADVVVTAAEAVKAAGGGGEHFTPQTVARAADQIAKEADDGMPF